MPWHHPPIEPSYRDAMNKLGALLTKAFPGKGFTLFVFDLGKVEGGTLNYLSNADRDDMLRTLQEFINAQKKE